MTTTDASVTARVFRENIQTIRQRSMADLVPEVEESPNQIEIIPFGFYRLFKKS